MKLNLRFSYYYYSLFLLLSSTTIWGQSSLDYERETVIYKTVPFVYETNTSMDVYYPKSRSGNRPVVIWVHGGGWANGDKRQNIRPKLRFCQDMEYILVSVNHRLSPIPKSSVKSMAKDRLRHPSHASDVADAIKWVSNSIQAYGGDPSKIAIMGHSSGAHLVALLGTDISYLTIREVPIDHIKGIVSLDTRAYDIPHAIRSATPKSSMVYLNAFGEDPIEQKNASPSSFIMPGKPIVKKWLFAERGEPVRRLILQNLMNQLELVDCEVSNIDASTLTHTQIEKVIGDKNDSIITPKIRTFLQSCFGDTEGIFSHNEGQK